MKNKVLLIDLDAVKRRRLFPNLALMKLSAYHKKRGDEVYLNFPLYRHNITYASCVFSWHKPKNIDPLVMYGGSGINYNTVLMPEIEHIMPDYSLYPTCNFSMGFTSRGCPNHCPFCIVRDKEGNIKATAEVREFYNPLFKRLLLLDNNAFASDNWDDTAEDLITLQVETDFNQGLDIRRLDDKKVWQLKQIRTKILRFAFDDIAYERQVRDGIQMLLKEGIRSRKIGFYVLVGFQKEDEAIERIKLLKSYNVEIYPMVYRDVLGKEPLLKYDAKEIILFHGINGNNFRRFLRILGRL